MAQRIDERGFRYGTPARGRTQSGKRIKPGHAAPVPAFQQRQVKVQRAANLRRSLEQQGKSGVQIRDILSRHGLIQAHGKFGNLQQASTAGQSGPGWFLAKIIGDLADAAVHMPGGVYSIGKAYGQDMAALMSGHPERVHHTGDITKEMGKQTLRSIEHPLEHPGYTLLNLGAGAGAVASGVARAGLLGRAVAAGDTAGALRAVAGRMPPPGPRVIKAGGFEQNLRFSRAPLTRAIQRTHDAVLHRLAQGTPEGLPKVKPGDTWNKIPTDIEVGDVQAATGKVVKKVVWDQKKSGSGATVTFEDGSKVHVPRGKKMLVATPGRHGFDLGHPIKSSGLRDVKIPKSVQQMAETRLNKLAGGGARYQHLIESSLARAPASELAHVRLSTPKQIALRMHGEGWNPAEGISFHERRIAHLQGEKQTWAIKREISRHQGRIALIKLAAKYVKPGEAGPTLLDPKLQDLYGKVEALSKGRENLLHQMDMLTPQEIATRVHAPEAIIRGGRVVTKSEADRTFVQVTSDLAKAEKRFEFLNRRLGMLSPAHGGKVARVKPELKAKWQAEFKGLQTQIPKLKDQLAAAEKNVGGGLTVAATRGKIRIPYSEKTSLPAPLRVAHTGILNMFPKKPGSLTHEFGGESMMHALSSEAVTKLVAQDYLEAQNYRQIVTLLERYKPAIHMDRRPGDIPVKIDPKIPVHARDLMKKVDAGIQLTKAEQKDLGVTFEEFMRETFPSVASPADLAAGHVGYINEAILGDLNKIPDAARLAHGSLRTMIHGWDTLNSAAKLMIIYAKIGYIPPNLLGNVFLNLAQQGFLAIPNLYKSARLSRTLGKADAHLVDVGMGRGLARGLFTDEKANILETVSSKTADVLSYPTDLYTRRASFLYEAQRLGFGSRVGRQGSIADLLHDPKFVREKIEAFQRAREAAIEYENLRPWEKTAARRLIFIYPWMKGSTMYAGRFARDHPIQTGIYSNIGQYGQKQSQKDFPLGLPSYMQGLFRIGGSDGSPMVLDPRSAAIFQTPAEVANFLRSVPTGQFNESTIPLGFANPVLQTLVGYLAQVNPQTREKLKPGTNLQDFIWNTFGRSTPIARLVQGIAGDKPPPTAIAQRTPWENIGHFLTGIYPYQVNAENARKKFLEENLAGASADTRTRVHGEEQMRQLEKAAHDTGLLPKGKNLPKTITKEYEWRIGRDAAIAKVTNTKDPQFQIKALRATLDFLVAHGVGTQADLKSMMAEAETMTPKDISRLRGQINRAHFSSPHINQGKKELARAQAVQRLRQTLLGYVKKGIGSKKEMREAMAQIYNMNERQIESFRQEIIHRVSTTHP